MSDDVHAQSAPYALNALPPDERAAFEEHLRSCSACRAEVASLAAVAARLGAAEATSPPPTLRNSVLGRLASTSQLPSADRPDRQRSGSRVSTWLLAAAALLLVVAGGAVVSQHNRVEVLEAQNRQISAVLAAPDAVARHSKPEGSGTLAVVASRQLDRAVVVVGGLPQLSTEKTYQMWLIGEAGPRSAGLMAPPAPRETAAVVLDSIQQAEQIAITVEPTGGSSAPTTTPVIGAQLA